LVKALEEIESEKGTRRCVLNLLDGGSEDGLERGPRSS